MDMEHQIGSQGNLDEMSGTYGKAMRCPSPLIS